MLIHLIGIAEWFTTHQTYNICNIKHLYVRRHNHLIETQPMKLVCYKYLGESTSHMDKCC